MRGYQKRIIYLKNTGSHIFDEAYFVVSPSATKAKKDDMVLEANRIIEESIGARQNGKKTSAPGFLHPFLLGAATSFAIFSVIYIINLLL